MENQNSRQPELPQLPQKRIFRPDALTQYSQRQQQDIWPHLKLPSYVPYLWLLLGVTFLIALVIGIGINLELAAETAVHQVTINMNCYNYG